MSTLKLSGQQEVDSTEYRTITAPCESFIPNGFKLYNTIGNVAEMVEEKGIAKGGSYLHSSKEAEIMQQLPYEGANHWLGFRCVASYQ